MNAPKLICFFVVDGFQTLDIFGPLEAFAAAGEVTGGAYRWVIASLNRGAVRSESGPMVVADTPLDQLRGTHTLFLIGGAGPRKMRLAPDALAALNASATRATRVASVCTGASLLAQLRVSEGKRVATHWRHASDLADAYPGLEVDSENLYVRDGNVWSSAGVTAGIDLAMAMIAEDVGQSVASSVARQLVVYARRGGSQSQFSEPLNAQSQHNRRLGYLSAWITDNLARPLPVEVLAERAGMSLRHFTRVFSESFGIPPARYVERLRLDKARVLLSQGDGRIDTIARAVGFQSSDTFRRAFERELGVSPTRYREQFPER